MSSKLRNFLARAALFSATMIWGSSFFLTKSTVNEIGAFYIISTRFLTGAVLIGALFWGRLKKIDAAYIKRGSLLGVLLFFAYVFQTYGLKETTPGKSAFLTAVYCIIVPFIYCIVEKKPPKGAHIMAALLCMTGIGLVSLNEYFALGRGEVLTLLCGLFLALHIVAVAHFSKDQDIIVLTVLQFLSAGVIGLLAALIFNSPPQRVSLDTAMSLAYLSIFSTAIALLLQNIGQKYTHAATASVILSLESVFGALFSIIFYGEVLTLRTGVGFLIIFFAIILSELGNPFLIFSRPKNSPSS